MQKSPQNAATAQYTFAGRRRQPLVVFYRFQLDLKLPVDNYMSPQSVIKNVTSAVLCTL